MGRINDPAPGFAGKLLVAFCLATIAWVTARSIVGMADTLERGWRQHTATDCEAMIELCEEELR